MSFGIKKYAHILILTRFNQFDEAKSLIFVKI